MAISVEKLEKIYSEKKGVEVHALKGISFNLPDKGMVFILGKSGCGKSTLLNVLGGLDGFDNGDIVIAGQSIKGYTAKQLDSYRNDYIGFVFQEHCLIEKESAKSNISLALELQREKDTDGKVEAILESVGLKDFADQKCNCLSGGQKQRVAIARALIKNPKLLLCDEPTGALDSATGKEIFTLLKELSRDRLVVVVSHDRESAEKYGDRVIELKDGEIISDSAPQTEKPALKQEPAKTEKHGGLRFLRALKMGASYIIVRPVRMAICLLLCLITFIFVGVADTLNAFDRDKALLYTMEEVGSTFYAFGNAFNYDDRHFALHIPNMSIDEAEELSALLDVDRCDFIYLLGGNWGGSRLNVAGYSYNDLLFEKAVVTGYVEADASFVSDYGFTLRAGRMPETTHEIALPEYLFNYYKVHGFDGEDGVIAINSYEDLVGKSFKMKGYRSSTYIQPDSPEVTVTGIVDTHFVYDRQAEVLFNGAEIYKGFIDDLDYISYDVLHNSIFVCKGFYSYFNGKFGYDKYNEVKGVVKRVIAPYKGSKSQKLKNLRVYTAEHNAYFSDYENSDRRYHLVNYCAVMVEQAEDTFYTFHEYAQYLVPVLIVIAVLFLFYYSSGTINEKRREVGILRALGASRGDILKVTSSEHGVFTAVTVAISSVISLVLTVVINNFYTKGHGISTVLIKFGIRQFAVIAAVAIAAVVIGIAFPLYKLLKAKPVDVIADRK